MFVPYIFHYAFDNIKKKIKKKRRGFSIGHSSPPYRLDCPYKLFSCLYYHCLGLALARLLLGLKVMRFSQDLSPASILFCLKCNLQVAGI